MKQFTKKKLWVLVLAFCLITTNITMAFAETTVTQNVTPTVTTTAPTNPPSITAIDQEITATATYVKNFGSFNASTDFYNTSKNLILLLRSGIDCSHLVYSYLNEISTTYVINGKLILSDPLEDYAYLAIILALAHKDATNFNGINVIEQFEKELMNSTQLMLNKINPYKLAHIYNTVNAYSNEFNDSTTCLSRLKTAIFSYANENGINYWGNSTDNNGFVLSGLSPLISSDHNFKTIVDNAITFSKTLFKPDGTSAGDFQWSLSPNADSTAASLSLYSTYGENELAYKSYYAMLTFKNTDSLGAYGYNYTNTAESLFATIDALYSLLTYRSVLANQSSPFDVSDTDVKSYLQVIDKINALSPTISLDDAVRINSITTLYNSLSNEFKAKVTNYAKFETTFLTYNNLLAIEAEKAKIEADQIIAEAERLAIEKANDKANLNQSPPTGDSYHLLLFASIMVSTLTMITMISSNNYMNKKRKKI